MKERIKVDLKNGQVCWSRGGNGISVGQFVSEDPCTALEYLASGSTDELAEAILSAVGGKGNLVQLNNDKNCGCDNGQLEQV
jgi:hypothetical protein